MANAGTAPQTTLEKIMVIATEAFDDKEKAERWMQQPNIQLGWRKPIDVIGYPEGYNAVETVLYQIQYALFGQGCTSLGSAVENTLTLTERVRRSMAPGGILLGLTSYMRVLAEHWLRWNTECTRSRTPVIYSSTRLRFPIA